MASITHIRAWIRPARYLDEARQRLTIEAATRDLGSPLLTVYVHPRQSVETWVRALRSDEVAMVAKLHVIAPIKPEGKRPLVVFTGLVTEAVRRALFVVDADSGITSRDGKKWRDLLELNANLVAAGGRTIGAKRAKAMARKRWDKAAPGTVERWASPLIAKERDRWASMWRDRVRYPNAEAVWDALPDEMQQEFGSLRTMRTILGPRIAKRPRKSRTK